MKKMIFHYPLPLDPNATSASGIRPVKMLNAFKELGYDVFVVSGYGKERKEKIIKLEKMIKSGEEFAFVYSEASTQPTLLTEKNHIPKYPFLDFGFFKLCKKHNIKISLFYRDIYWRFSDYGKELSVLKKLMAKSFYWYDLYQYEKYVDILYLPSIQMANYIPLISKEKLKPLPPGCDDFNIDDITTKNESINLLYIGGLGNHYKMHKLFTVLKEFPSVNLTICTRENEWQKVKNEYEKSKNITIVHKSGDELKELYKSADIALVYVEPLIYREFAVPVKLFEYIGYEKPILATKDTLAGEFVESNSIGWSVDYSKSSLKEFFYKLLDNKDIILQTKKSIRNIKKQHTWIARALQVEKDLG